MDENHNEKSKHAVNNIDSIKADSDFFKRMINFIPTTFYFNKESKNKLHDIEKETLESIAPASSSHGPKRKQVALSGKGKAKRAKFDPSLMRTVTSVQESLLNHGTSKQGQKKALKKPQRSPASGATELPSYAQSMDDLQEKLRTKLHLFKEKRNAFGKNEKLEKKKMARRVSKLKLRMRREEEKKIGKNKSGEHKSTSVINGGSPPSHKSSPSKPIFNKEGKMVFSKFDFTEGEKKNKSSKKNFKQLLEKATREKEELKKLKETDSEAAKTKSKKDAWKKALQKAEGVKVRDDPELLKKSIKKQEKLKQKSGKEWTERKEKVDKRMNERQEKRSKNIRAKKQSRLDGKIKKAKKKGRILPGF